MQGVSSRNRQSCLMRVRLEMLGPNMAMIDDLSTVREGPFSPGLPYTVDIRSVLRPAVSALGYAAGGWGAASPPTRRRK